MDYPVINSDMQCRGNPCGCPDRRQAMTVMGDSPSGQGQARAARSASSAIAPTYNWNSI